MSQALVYFLLLGDLIVMALMISLLLWALLRRGREDASRSAQIPLHDEASGNAARRATSPPTHDPSLPDEASND